MDAKSPGTRALRKGRHSQNGMVYSVTMVTHNRIAWFEDFRLACLFSRRLHRSARSLDMDVLCWVLMPDHVHLLYELKDTRLEKSVQRLKAGTARSLNRAIGRKGKFWQAGYFDHGVRQHEDIRAIARYIVGNPLRASLVTRIGDYPFWNAVWL